MKHWLKTISILLLLLFAISCNTSKKEKREASPTGTKVIIENPCYSIDTSGTSLQWTAYKFTDKLGVSGTFDEFRLQVKTDSNAIDELLKGAKITIHTHSVNSGNVIRDPKLRTSFFKVFNTDTIFGEVIDVGKSVGVLELKMNGITNDTTFDYTINNDTLQLSTHLDLLSWNGEEAIKTLNKACYELHTGMDGISKLWPDVNVVLKIPIKTNTGLE